MARTLADLEREVEESFELTLVLAPETAARAVNSCPFPLKKHADIRSKPGKASGQDPVQGSGTASFGSGEQDGRSAGTKLETEALLPEGSRDQSHSGGGEPSATPQAPAAETAEKPAVQHPTAESGMGAAGGLLDAEPEGTGQVLISEDVATSATARPNAPTQDAQKPEAVSEGSADGTEARASAEQAGPQIFTLEFQRDFGYEEEKQLMEWFSDVINPKPQDGDEGNPRKATSSSLDIDVICFPPSLSKLQRAHWHKMSEKFNLTTFSEGFGAERALKMGAGGASSSSDGVVGVRGQDWSRGGGRGRGRGRWDAPAAGGKPAMGTRAQRERSKKIWDWCQAEGGAYSDYSQTEILQILTTTTIMPPDLARLCGKRDMCKRMVEKIQRKDGEGAISMLEREPSMAWMRDVDTGAYPLHIAVWQGMCDVVEHITKQASTLAQRDKQYKTPLQIARKYRQARIVHLLKERLEAAGMAEPPGEPAPQEPSPRSPSNSRWSKKQSDTSTGPTEQKNVEDSTIVEVKDQQATPSPALEAGETGHASRSTAPAESAEEQSPVSTHHTGNENSQSEDRAAAEKLAAHGEQPKGVASEAAEVVGQGKDVASSAAVQAWEPGVGADQNGRAGSSAVLAESSAKEE